MNEWQVSPNQPIKLCFLEDIIRYEVGFTTFISKEGSLGSYLDVYLQGTIGKTGLYKLTGSVIGDIELMVTYKLLKLTYIARKTLRKGFLQASKVSTRGAKIIPKEWNSVLLTIPF